MTFPQFPRFNLGTKKLLIKLWISSTEVEPWYDLSTNFWNLTLGDNPTTKTYLAIIQDKRLARGPQFSWVIKYDRNNIIFYLNSTRSKRLAITSTCSIFF